MTIEASLPRRVGFRALLIGFPVALALWGLVLLVMALLQPAGRPVAVIALGGPDAALAAVVAAGGAILEVRATSVIAIAKQAGFVPRLYANGALLVFGARGVGCGLGTGIPGFGAARPA